MTEDTRRSLCSLSDIDFAVRRIEALEAQIKAADALAEALTPFSVTLERYSGFTEYALFGIWEDVNGAAGRKLNILRMANFDDAKAALAAYRATKEGQ